MAVPVPAKGPPVSTLRPALAALALLVPCLLHGAEPPPAPSRPVVEKLHGVEVADPYRNLEDLSDPATQDWLKAQGAYAAKTLAAIDGRDALAGRIAELSASSGDQVRWITRMPDDRVYYLLRRAGENQLKLMLRKGRNPPQVLVDPEVEARATGVPHAINYYAPSWDGRTLAYGMSQGGSEDASLHLVDIDSGKPLHPPIPRVQTGAVHWSPDSRTVTYNQLRALPADAAASEFYLDSTVYALRPRERAAAPRPLFGPLVDRGLGLERLDVGEVFFAPGSDTMVARTTDTTVPEGKVFVAPLADLGRERPRWRQLTAFDDHITDVQLRGRTLYLRTYAGAPRGRVLALDLARPRLADAKEVVPEPDAGVLESFVLTRDALLGDVKQGFTTRVRRYAAGGPAQGLDIAPAVQGSLFAIDDPARRYRDAWLNTSAWTEPPRVLVAGRDGVARDTGLRKTQRPPGMPEIEVQEVLVPSHDGARVPLAILARKGLPRDGARPTLLVGYGAYGFTFEARFDPRAIAWFERGGVLALVNPRGSGAFGDAWYRAGFKATKPNTWKDGIAAARYLVEQRVASPRTMGIWGTSAGGIFVGRAVTAAPELFAAAIFDVGVMDTVRFETSANGITNISEFGSAKNPDEFPALLEMSTYHQIRDDVDYPAVLLIHGMNDPRVDVWHSAKAAARLQAASHSGRPVLLRIDGQAGHGMGSTQQQDVDKLADIYAFLLWQFGTPPGGSHGAK